MAKYSWCKCGSTYVIVCPDCHEYTQTWQWIRVKDRLPTQEGQYLVVVCHLNCLNHVRQRMKVARFNKSGEHKKAHFYGNQTFRAKDITHWMPLPKPPKEIDDCVDL